MTILFNPNDFEIKEFYRYPTTVVRRIVEWDEGFHKNSPDNVEDVKDLFEALFKIAEEKTKIDLRDNKIAMRIIYKPTNTEFYIGYKDWNWSLGLDLNRYDIGEKIVL
jgi:hypothetical protein